MDEYITVALASIWMTICVVFGALLWMKRKEVPDRSRTYLAVICFLGILAIIAYFSSILRHEITEETTQILLPKLAIGGVWAISVFVCYPIEVMHPRELRGWWLVLLFLPALLLTLPLLFGLQFHELHSWAELKAHIGDFDVLLRLTGLFFLGIISLILLFLPYNWRTSSADNRWIRRTSLAAQGITVLFYATALSNHPIFYFLHVMWAIGASLFFFYFELVVRLLPPAKEEAHPAETPKANVPIYHTDAKEDYWPLICQVMDECEEWRNPNTTVETVSQAIGTNRYYVGQIIREHTGLTFNDYMNRKRIEFMAAQLHHNPQQDQKALYFEAGFRSRTAAYRNFVKFMGCAPSDFAASI